MSQQYFLHYIPPKWYSSVKSLHYFLLNVVYIASYHARDFIGDNVLFLKAIASLTSFYGIMQVTIPLHFVQWTICKQWWEKVYEPLKLAGLLHSFGWKCDRSLSKSHFQWIYFTSLHFNTLLIPKDKLYAEVNIILASWKSYGCSCCGQEWSPCCSRSEVDLLWFKAWSEPHTDYNKTETDLHSKTGRPRPRKPQNQSKNPTESLSCEEAAHGYGFNFIIAILFPCSSRGSRAVTRTKPASSWASSLVCKSLQLLDWL